MVAPASDGIAKIKLFKAIFHNTYKWLFHLQHWTIPFSVKMFFQEVALAKSLWEDNNAGSYLRSIFFLFNSILILSLILGSSKAFIFVLLGIILFY